MNEKSIPLVKQVTDLNGIITFYTISNTFLFLRARVMPQMKNQRDRKKQLNILMKFIRSRKARQQNDQERKKNTQILTHAE